jgi:6-pyruvoyltetrahydropterin/6-carboxytetrahydropterin synthase
MLSLTRTARFHATHRMYRLDWTAEQNRQHFGAVSEYHPHDYEVGVTVSGSPDPETGMLVDLVELDRIVDEEVIRRCAYQQLNTALPEFAAGRPLPTCEALASILYGHIAARLPAGIRLLRVRVAEDPTLYAECVDAPLEGRL